MNRNRCIITNFFAEEECGFPYLYDLPWLASGQLRSNAQNCKQASTYFGAPLISAPTSGASNRDA